MTLIPQGGGELVRILVYDPVEKQWVQATNLPETLLSDIRDQRAPVSVRLEDLGTGTMYLGTAAVGSAEDAPVWQMKLINTGSMIKIRYANGSTAYNQRWDQRASLSYS